MTLSRQTQKVFASNADADQLAVFGSMKTGTPVYSSNLSTLQSQKYTEGWTEAILNDKAPYLEEMNAVQYGLSYQIAYLLQQGLSIEYDTNTTYKKGSVVAVISGTDVTYYKSIADNNTGNAVTNTTYWILDSISKIETYYNALNDAMVKLTGNQSIDGTKTFTGTVKVPNTTTAGTALALAERGNYYIKFGDGTIIQWGNGDTVNHYAYVNTYITYTSAYRVFFTDSGSNTSLAQQKVIEYISLKRFRVYSSSSSSNGDAFNWFTIGR